MLQFQMVALLITFSYNFKVANVLFVLHNYNNRFTNHKIKFLRLITGHFENGHYEKFILLYRFNINITFYAGILCKIPAFPLNLQTATIIHSLSRLAIDT